MKTQVNIQEVLGDILKSLDPTRLDMLSGSRYFRESAEAYVIEKFGSLEAADLTITNPGSWFSKLTLLSGEFFWVQIAQTNSDSRFFSFIYEHKDATHAYATVPVSQIAKWEELHAIHVLSMPKESWPRLMQDAESDIELAEVLGVDESYFSELSTEESE